MKGHRSHELSRPARRLRAVWCAFCLAALNSAVALRPAVGAEGEELIHKRIREKYLRELNFGVASGRIWGPRGYWDFGTHIEVAIESLGSRERLAVIRGADPPGSDIHYERTTKTETLTLHITNRDQIRIVRRFTEGWSGGVAR